MSDKYANQPTPWRNEKKLRRLYATADLSTQDVARRLGCNRKTVEKWLDKFDIEKERPWRDRAIIEYRLVTLCCPCHNEIEGSATDFEVTVSE